MRGRHLPLLLILLLLLLLQLLLCGLSLRFHGVREAGHAIDLCEFVPESDGVFEFAELA